MRALRRASARLEMAFAGRPETAESGMPPPSKAMLKGTAVP